MDTLTFEPILVNPYKSGFLVYNERNPGSPGVFEINAESLYADRIIPVDIESMVGGMTVEEDRFLFIKPYRTLPNLTFENKNGKWIKIPHMLDTLEWFRIYQRQKK